MEHLDLSDLTDRLERTALDAGLHLVAARLDPARGPVVRCAPDAETFVAIAVRVGADVLYLQTIVVDDDLLEEHAPDASPEDRAQLLAAHGGEAVTVNAGFAHGGVVHTIDTVAGWWTEWMAQLDFRAQIQSHEDLARLTGLARQAATDERFRPGTQHVAERERLIGELAPDLAEDEITEVEYRASRIYDREVRPVREAAQAARARELLADGWTKVATAREVGVTVHVLNRLIATR